MEHFSPAVAALFRQAKRKSQLLPIFSQSTGTPTSQTAPLLQIPWKRLQRGAALRRVESQPEKNVGSSLWPTLVPQRQRKAKRRSHAGKALLQSVATVLKPQKQPLTPPTHAHTVSHTHS